MYVFIYKLIHFLSTKQKSPLVSASSRACRRAPAGQKGMCTSSEYRQRKRLFPQHRDSHKNLSAMLLLNLSHKSP